MIEILLTQGQVALIDNCDYELVSGYRWCAHRGCLTFYAITNILLTDGKRASLLMHRLILSAPPHLETDHIDHDGLNNQRINLRLCTCSQNHMNGRARRGRSSPFKGVRLFGRKWLAEIGHGGKSTCLGLHNTPEEAALAYDAKARELFGEFSCTNFPTEG